MVSRFDDWETEDNVSYITYVNVNDVIDELPSIGQAPSEPPSFAMVRREVHSTESSYEDQPWLRDQITTFHITVNPITSNAAASLGQSEDFGRFVKNSNGLCVSRVSYI
ncbi:hypothetical protein E3N88_21963 [Mikania micrantha]|uniref:Uncharacterized protein n=1 Tax=Mikania micrantha TaxID=192012 RepID=A0A5N6N922_9ASTR|nr:hypothetical protein E3N88_21963 [Mikania micrantha]